MVIRTKLFEGHFEETDETYIEYGKEKKKRRFVPVDEEINRFVIDTGVEIVDIKFAVAMSTEDVITNALLIYKGI